MLIGAGTGYTAALLSSLVESVIAIETRAQMVEKAQQAVAGLDIGNVAVIKARLQDGYASEAPYDAIIIEGAVEQIPRSLLDQLSDGGRLAAIWRPKARKQVRPVFGIKQERRFPEPRSLPRKFLYWTNLEPNQNSLFRV